MKQFLQTLLALVVFTTTALQASAADFEVDGINYNVLEDGKSVEVTHSYNYSGDIIIPARVIYDDITFDVTSIGMSAFYCCYKLTSIKIPNSVTAIGMYAFQHCSYLTSIEIPNSVSSIEETAFRACLSLTSIYYNSDVLVAGDNSLFDAEVYEQATLYLTEAGFAMSNHVSPWKYFLHKEVYDFSGIKSVETDSSNAGVEYYNLNGVRSNGDTLTPGLYIRKQGNSTEKVMVR